jgi:hypothetical protein
VSTFESVRFVDLDELVSSLDELGLEGFEGLGELGGVELMLVLNEVYLSRVGYLDGFPEWVGGLID